jgi:molybdopterin/thiamine biosynthesis adenylyltransferase
MSLELSAEEWARYARHTVMPEFGMAGQRKLKAGSALVVGTGGLGSPVALYLAAAGIGRIGLVDDDVVDSSNLQRQVIHSMKEVGELKVESARRRMMEINPHVQVDIYPERFRGDNSLRIAVDYDVVVDGCDNFETRYVINNTCVRLQKPYVYGAVLRFEGQASVFDAQHGPCYRCLFAEPPPPGAVPDGVQAGVLGMLPGTIGTIQAAEVVKLLIGIGTPLIGRLLLYDALEMSFQIVKLRKNLACKACGSLS